MKTVSEIIKNNIKEALNELSWNISGYNWEAQKRLRYVDYLVSMFPNTDIEIDEDVVFEQYKLGLK